MRIGQWEGLCVGHDGSFRHLNLGTGVVIKSGESRAQNLRHEAANSGDMGGVAYESLIASVERFLAAAGDHRRVAFRTLIAELKALQKVNAKDAVVRALRLSIVPSLDFTSAQSLLKILKAIPPNERDGQKLKLAVLGGFTTHQLCDLIELCLFAWGIEVEIYEADYDVFRQEILDPASGLYAFAPNIIYIATHWRNLGHKPDLSASAQDVEQMLEAEMRDWKRFWQSAQERLDCQIVQNNFDTPPWRGLDNHEMRHPAALSRFIAEMNRRLVDGAPSYVTVHDVDGLAASAGRKSWANERFYLHAKMPCAPDYLVEYAYSVASVVAAQRGQSKKCLVLDLDNTLWGGVIGDDGMVGIRIGQGDAEGEAFTSFQKYAKLLASRGVILAVCSKNTDEIAREVFETHPDMVLGINDIACFVANWTDKATNLRRIAKDLNIGLDSLVFIDDNPAERSIIRQLVPEVAVPEVSTDPIEFIEVLEAHRYFQVAALASDDFKRGEYYRLNAARAEIASASGDIEDFLSSLDMRSSIRPIIDATLERSTQLINKSNQFNLTTRRKTVSDVLAATAADDWVTMTVTLTDRFGDNGLISVILAKVAGESLDIETWLMSCRVLKRGVERLVLNALVKEAEALGLTWLRGEYIPTPKNGIVRDHYMDLGFEKIETLSDGQTVWKLEIGGYQPFAHHITGA